MASQTPIEDEQFYGAIGRLTISWAQLELGLDAMVELTYYTLGGKDIENEIPRALNRKIAYLRKVFEKAPLPDDAKAGYSIMLDRLHAASETRHDIIHGTIIEYAERSGEATMIRALRHRGGLTKRQYTKTTSEILVAAKDAQKLATQVLQWVIELHDVIRELLKPNDEQTG